MSAASNTASAASNTASAASNTAAGQPLTLEGVTVGYGPQPASNPAVESIDLEVGAGEILAVLGPSGSGKSTLLRAVAGLEPLVAGRIKLGDRDLANIATHRRGLGLMFQDHALFQHLSVADNIGYGLKVTGWDRAARKCRVAELLDLVGLSSVAGRRPDQLSGGQAQRVALARALAPQPGLVMLDEPLGSLDRNLREQLTADLSRLFREIGQTALYVTHDQGEAFALADRVAVIDDGRLRAIDRPDRLWRNPGSVFVARFLGHQNVWSVTVNSDRSVVWSDTRLGRLTDEHVLAATPGPSMVAVPDTALALIPIDRKEADDQLEATVVNVGFESGFYRVEALAGSETVLLRCRDEVETGETYSLRLDLRQLVPLDP